MEHAGRGQKLPESFGLPEEEVLPKTFTIDTTSKTPRMRSRDAEIKIMNLLDEAVADVLEKHHLSPDDIEVEMIMESTFEPCSVCKIEILSRLELYNGKMELRVPYWKDTNGIWRPVKDSIEFDELINK